MTPQKRKEVLYCQYGHSWISLHRYGIGEQHGRICENCEKEELTI